MIKKRDKEESDCFIFGYEKGLADGEKAEEIAAADDVSPFTYPNPFKAGTEEWRGYEEAVYDLTQK